MTAEEFAHSHRVTVNANDWAAIKITETGWRVYNEFYTKLGFSPSYYRRYVRTLPDGRVLMQLWEIMHMFGQAMTIGFDPPIETDITIVSERIIVP